MTYICKKEATAGLKKRHGQNRDLGNIEVGAVNEWRAVGGGWLENWETMGTIGKDFCPNFLQPRLENVDRKEL